MKKILTIHHTDGTISRSEITSVVILPHNRVVEALGVDGSIAWVPLENTLTIGVHEEEEL